MHELHLSRPSLADVAAIAEYKAEMLANGDSLDGGAFLEDYDDIAAWIELTEMYENEDTVPDGHVPGSVFLAYRKSDGRLVGLINLRHYLNDFLFRNFGHIGYSVRPSERRKGYATEMVNWVLNEARKYDIDSVLITCAKDNIGSAKTIIANGGMLEKEVEGGDRITQRYWIALD